MRGRSLLEDLREMNRQIEILGRRLDQMTDRVEELRRQNEEHQKEITSLEGQVGRLVPISENFSTDEGDAIADAFLFDHDHRSDTDLYRELYGLEYRKVLEIYSMYK